jgi:hypothetical protein
VLAAEHRALSSIGFRTPRGSDLGWGLILGIALFAGTGILDWDRLSSERRSHTDRARHAPLTQIPSARRAVEDLQLFPTIGVLDDIQAGKSSWRDRPPGSC